MRLLALLVLLLGLAVPPGRRPRQPRRLRPLPGARTCATRSGVLHDWDDRRAGAWARSDEAALRALYVPRIRCGSRRRAAAAVATTARGLVVRRLETQVFGVRSCAALAADGRHARPRPRGRRAVVEARSGAAVAEQPVPPYAGIELVRSTATTGGWPRSPAGAEALAQHGADVGVAEREPAVQQRLRHERSPSRAAPGPSRPRAGRRTAAGTCRNAGRCTWLASSRVNSAFVGACSQHRLTGPDSVVGLGEVDDGVDPVAGRDHRHVLAPVAEPAAEPGLELQPQRAQRLAAPVVDRGGAHDAHAGAGLAGRLGGRLPGAGDPGQQGVAAGWVSSVSARRRGRRR